MSSDKGPSTMHGTGRPSSSHGWIWGRFRSKSGRREIVGGRSGKPELNPNRTTSSARTPLGLSPRAIHAFGRFTRNVTSRARIPRSSSRAASETVATAGWRRMSCFTRAGAGLRQGVARLLRDLRLLPHLAPAVVGEGMPRAVVRREQDVVGEPVGPLLVPVPEPLPDRDLGIAAGEEPAGILLSVA